MIRFGTDGIRGVFGEELTLDIAYKFGNAISGNVLIGHDTRFSSSMLADKLIEGLVDAGGNATYVGVCPTAGVAYLTRKEKCDFGVVITASHNPSEYNGIKLFGKNGQKIDSGCEKLIEKHINFENIIKKNKKGKRFDKLFLLNEYIEFLHKNVSNSDFSKFKIVLDCANGAAYKIAPTLFEKMGVKIFLLGCEPDGRNINKNCGSLHIENLQKEVVLKKADFGFSFDGDADRLIAVDENGAAVDGDMLLYLIATNYLEKEKLNKRTVVGTKMTNLGVEKAFCEKGISLSRVDVGDKYINEELERKCLLLGAEQSGHILMKDRHSTGDGILSALVVTEICKEKKKNLSQFFDFEKYKQTIKNVFVKNRDEVFESEELKNEIEKQNKLLKNDGRILVRKSGTEPLIRIMVESKDENLNNKIAEDIEMKIHDFEK